MKLVRAGDPSPSEPKNTFTGEARLVRSLAEQRLAGMRVARANFTAGGRTFWHRHHGEQVLYVLSGRGYVQRDGEEPQMIEPGDVVYVASGEKHWHGAQPGQNLEHLAVTTGETEWEEEVEEQMHAATEPSGAARVQRWEHTALAVADLDHAIAFYQQAFGYKILLDQRGISERIRSLMGLPTVECEVAQLCSPISQHVLELIAFGNVPLGSEEHGPTRPGSGHLSFVVEDLATALTAVARLGATPLGDVTCFPDGRRVYCRDPSGNFIELAELAASVTALRSSL
jgi:quercetin dioxygenase-like cupin family protein/predicted enzyme related to lactoylglutathione lyase